MITKTIALGLAILCAGCGQQSGSGFSLGQPDPKTSFERFAPQFLAELQKYETKKWNSESPDDRHTKPNEILRNEALYDVRKTDSLVHPYEGIITYINILYPTLIPPIKMTWELHFGFDNGKWTPTTYFYAKDGSSGRIDSNSESWWTAYQQVQQ